MSGPVTTEILHSSLAPGNGWTPQRKALFLDRMAVHGNARAACRAVGLSAEAAYKLRRRDPLFARGWAAALVLARENGEQVLAERAIEGVEEQIFYRGELIGTRRRYDSRLLLAHLARLDRLADERAANADAGRFDELLACIADGTDADLPPVRRAFVQQAAQDAADAERDLQIECYPELFDPARGDLSAEECDILAELDEICDEVTDAAAATAALAWDRRVHSAFETVDAFGLIPPAPAIPLLLLAERSAPGPVTPNTAPVSFPCSLSTVSIASLALALARPAIPRIETPRSPWGSRSSPCRGG